MKSKLRIRTALELFRQFFLFGLFTFGGGWSIVAQIQKVYVDKQGSISKEELLDLTSVARSFPGVMICNTACIFGFRMGGVPGAIGAVFGLVSAPTLVLSLVTMAYQQFRDNVYVAQAMVGIRAAVVPIIGSVLVTLWPSAFKWRICYLATAIAFVLYLIFDFGSVELVIFGALFGLVASELHARKEAGHGPA